MAFHVKSMRNCGVLCCPCNISSCSRAARVTRVLVTLLVQDVTWKVLIDGNKAIAGLRVLGSCNLASQRFARNHFSSSK